MIRRQALLAVLVAGLAACGGERTAPPSWRHCTIEGVTAAGGLAAYRGDLLVACGGDQRRVFAVSREGLTNGGRVRARALDLEHDDDAFLMGADLLATQGYRLRHLWSLQVDFQGIAVQPPDFVYLADRVRRIVYWGRLGRDAAGRTQRVHLRGCLSAPGAQRTEVGAGDWRDKGPGLAGIAAVAEGGKTEDLYALDRLTGEGGTLRLHRLNRYGSFLGSIEVRPAAGSQPTFGGLERRAGGFVFLHGDGVSEVDDPRGRAPLTLPPASALPQVPGVSGWTGVALGPGGTLYLVSGGEPAILAWRPAAAAVGAD